MFVAGVGALLELSVVFSLAMQLVEDEDVVDETPAVVVWFELSVFMLDPSGLTR